MSCSWESICRRVLVVQWEGLCRAVAGSFSCSGRVFVVQWQGPCCTVKGPCRAVEGSLSCSGRVFVVQWESLCHVELALFLFSSPPEQPSLLLLSVCACVCVR